jgi:hypothetical protein
VPRRERETQPADPGALAGVEGLTGLGHATDGGSQWRVCLDARERAVAVPITARPIWRSGHAIGPAALAYQPPATRRAGDLRPGRRRSTVGPAAPLTAAADPGRQSQNRRHRHQPAGRSPPPEKVQGGTSGELAGEHRHGALQIACVSAAWRRWRPRRGGLTGSRAVKDRAATGPRSGYAPVRRRQVSPRALSRTAPRVAGPVPAR